MATIPLLHWNFPGKDHLWPLPWQIWWTHFSPYLSEFSFTIAHIFSLCLQLSCLPCYTHAHIPPFLVSHLLNIYSFILKSSYVSLPPSSQVFLPILPFFIIIIFFGFCFVLFYFTILYWFCHTSTCIRHGCTHVPHPEPPSHLPPHTIPLGHPSAPAPSFLYPASNLDWQFFYNMKVIAFIR